MILDSFDKIEKLCKLCQKYDDRLNIVINNGCYSVNGASILGLISFFGKDVTAIATGTNSLDDEININMFRKEFDEI